MSFPVLQRSYPAGSSSTDPDRSRFVESGQGARLKQLAEFFPELRKEITPDTAIISAYPAALGLDGVAPFTDTYLHPPTFISAFRLAEQEARPVLLAAQPLVGASLLQELCKSGFRIPSRILWGVGGYLVPISLESFVRGMLEPHGCEVKFLYSYGVAEIGHTCFAATERSETGQPRYRKVDPSVMADTVGDDNQLRLTSASGRQVLTEDHASVEGEIWTLTSSPNRVHPSVLEELESWGHEEWGRRTGYIHATPSRTVVQLRRDIDPAVESSELEFHEFWRVYGGSFTTKPAWKLYENESD